MISFLTLVETILGSPYTLIITLIICISLKLFISITLIGKKEQLRAAHHHFLLLFTSLGCSLISDCAWLALTLYDLYGDHFLPYDIYLILITTSFNWLILSIEFQALGLFIETFTHQSFTLNQRQKIVFALSAFFSFIFLCYLIGNFYIGTLLYLQENIQTIYILYAFFFLSLSTIYTALHILSTPHISRLIKKQLIHLCKALVIPHISIGLFTLYFYSTNYDAHMYDAICITVTTLANTFIIFYCMRKVLALRFFNIRHKIDTKSAMAKINFVHEFKNLIDQLSHAPSLSHAENSMNLFFKDIIGIPLGSSNLYIRSSKKILPAAEAFLIDHSALIESYCYKHKKIVFDDLEFVHFYNPIPDTAQLIAFMRTIKADMFIPLFKENNYIHAYLIIDHYARQDQIYNYQEQQNIGLFANYLSTTIALLEAKNLDELLIREKELQDTLHQKDQEINYYKESVNSFLKHNQYKEIGIIIYKNRRFTFTNQVAKELIVINPNIQEGHHLSKALKKIAYQVEDFKAPQSCFVKNDNNKQLLILGVINSEYNSVIISVCYPDATDIINSHLTFLKDSNKWHYILYLESTKPGALINQFLPGTGEQILNLKIALFEKALSNKALLIQTVVPDMDALVEVMHHSSMRQTIHLLKLTSPVKDGEIRALLFGSQQNNNVIIKPLLERLNNVGTLCIYNIHFLDKETQELLAEFIKYGRYRPLKSDDFISSNVRLIFTTTHALDDLAKQGTFSSALLQELKKEFLMFPLLAQLELADFIALIEGYMQQALTLQEFKSIIELSLREKEQLISKRPESLHELKMKIHHLFMAKLKKHNLNKDLLFDPAYETYDPELVPVARLGKDALRDQKIMTLLWNKFKSQNKIADFLGVNRSSVNRRCKKYNLAE